MRHLSMWNESKSIPHGSVGMQLYIPFPMHQETVWIMGLSRLVTAECGVKFIAVLTWYTDITKQILTISLDQHWKILPLSCAMLPSALGQHCTTERQRTSQYLYNVHVYRMANQNNTSLYNVMQVSIEDAKETLLNILRAPVSYTHLTLPTKRIV